MLSRPERGDCSGSPDDPVLRDAADLSLDCIGGLKLYQRIRGYRYSVDALLLSDFVRKRKVRHCVDLGAGVGIVGLLIALRYPEAQVTGVEIQDSLAGLAQRNIVLNRLEDRVRICSGDIRAHDSLLLEERADLVVSNPPFRRLSAGRVCPAEERQIARHETSLSLEDLVAAASKVLEVRGSFCLVHLSERLVETLSVFARFGIQPKRLRFVHPREGEESKLVLMEGVKGGRCGIRVERPLFLHDGTGSQTAELNSRFDRSDATGSPEMAYSS